MELSRAGRCIFTFFQISRNFSPRFAYTTRYTGECGGNLPAPPPQILTETERLTMLLQTTPPKSDTPAQDVDDLIFMGQAGPIVSQR